MGFQLKLNKKMNNVTPTDGPRLYEPRTTCVRMWVFLWANRNGTLLLLFWLLVPAAGVVFQKVRPTRPELGG